MTWIKNIDTLSFKILNNKKRIPKKFYKAIRIEKLEDIANPTDEWTGCCVCRPHRKLNWIAKGKNNMWVMSITYGGWGTFTRYYFFDKEKGKLNINEVNLQEREVKTFGQTVSLVKKGEFEFEKIIKDE